LKKRMEQKNEGRKKNFDNAAPAKKTRSGRGLRGQRAKKVNKGHGRGGGV